AQEFGYNPEIILAGRRMNDSMGSYVATQVIKAMIQKDINIKGANILVLGITFKENCPDVRNTKVVDVIAALKEYGANISIHDPWADEKEVLHEYGLTSLKTIPNEKFDAVVLTVSHNKFKELDFSLYKNNISVIYDVKNFLEEKFVDGSL
ncbi:MAG: UDP binding domain-containing protein, partial [Flavobacteriales bacterium]